jgi:HEPN domain-containing protein
MNDNAEIEKLYLHWTINAEKDFVTMNNLFKSKDYHWSLFIGHIVIEKLLKAAVVKKTKNHAPFTHDLTKLASLTDLDFSDEYLDWLDTISTFNINARYDSYKEAFYKKCTEDFTKQWINRIIDLNKWIKTKL